MKLAVTTVILTALLFFSIVSIYAQGDLTPPMLVDLQIEPAMVDTRDSAQTITFTAHFTDDLSGFERSWLLLRPFESGTQRLGVGFDDRNQISGTELDGVYLDTAAIPQYAAEGRWLLDSAQIEDVVDNLYNSRAFYDSWPADFYDYHFANVVDTTATPTITPTPTWTPTPTQTPTPTVTPTSTPMPKLYLPLIEWVG